jgi:hypothetical protein
MHPLSSLLNITLHVSDSFSVHHQEFKTLLVHTASGIFYAGSLPVCNLGTRCIVPSRARLHTGNYNLYDIYLKLYVRVKS